MDPESRFSCQWHDSQQSILLITFPRYFDISELLHEVEVIQAMIEESSATRIDVILILNGSHISGGVDLLTLLHSLSLRIPVQFQSVIHVNSSAFTHMLTRNLAMLNRRFRRLIYHVDSVEQALSLIEELRSGTIPFR
ncbi:MAG: hypothetical protein KC496_22235 [Anaerolineae bacterium]|nr:hypothetical protein [Anaerolineae bacterium]